MRIPAEIRTYCPRCRRHTAHKVRIFKKGKESGLRRGVIHHEWEKKGYGGQKYPQQRRKAKVTKKTALILECPDCGYKVAKRGIRLKKAVIQR